jgi:5-methylcytosine-specific restriction endonuclease McrA
MATICTTCLRTTPTGQRCCTPTTHQAPGWDRYPRTYRRNRATILATHPPCHWGCGRPATTADHLIPRSQGGTHDLANLVPSCLPCNQSRGDTPADVWAERCRTRTNSSAATRRNVGVEDE